MAKKPSWRDAATGGGGSSNATPGQRGWQQTQAVGPNVPRKPWPKSAKIGVAALLLGVVVVGIAVVVSWLKPLKPACMVLIGAGYEDNLLLPHNALGMKSLKDLEAIAEHSTFISKFVPWEQSDKMRLLTHQVEEVTPRRSWDKIWNDLPLSFQEKTVIVYLSLHGVSDPKGPMLLANDPLGKARVPFEQVLKDLDRPSLQDKRIVLLLDLVHAQAHWPIGLLHNDFAVQLEKLRPRIEGQKNLVVIASSDQDQRSWASEEWRQTIFGHYVLEGLKGSADKNRDRRVDGLELYQYVRDKVRTWAQANRDSHQTPVLFGGEDRAQETELIQAVETVTEASPEEAPGRSFQVGDDLKKAWNRAKELKDVGVYIHNPHLWRAYQDTLLRYEQLVRVGDPTNRASDLKNKLDKLDGQMTQALKLEPAVGCLNFSLPLARAFGFGNALQADKVKDLYQRLTETPDKEELWSQALLQYPDRERRVLQVELFRMTLDDLRKVDTPSREDIKKSIAFLKKTEERLGLPRSAEVHTLVMLDQDALPDLTPDDVMLALHVRLLAEEAALAKPGATYPYSEHAAAWTQKEIEQADALRRKGEDFLFGAAGEHWSQARTFLRDAEKKYEEVLQEAALVQKAFTVRDRVWADLPALGQWLAFHRSADERRDKQLAELRGVFKNLTHQLDRLHRALDAAEVRQATDPIPHDDRNTNPIAMADLTAQIEADYLKILDAYQKVAKDLGEVVLHKNYHEIESVLQTATLDNFNLRSPLLRNSRTITSKLNSGGLQFDGVVGREEKAEQSRNRQAPVLTALTTYLMPTQAVIVGELGETLRDFFLNLPKSINDGLQDSLSVEQLKTAAERLKRPTHLCRIIPGGLVDQLQAEPYSVAEGLRRLLTQQMLFQQAKRTLLDHWFEEPGRLEPTYYIPAGRAYAQTARRLAEGKPESENPKLFHQRLQDLKDFEAKDLVEAKLKIDENFNKNWTTEKTFHLAWKLPADAGVPAGNPMVWLELDKVADQKQAQELSARRAVKQWPPEPIKVAASQSLWGGTTVRKVPLTFRAVYRGQRLVKDAELLRREPDIIADRFVPSPQSNLAIRMDPTFTYGAISIVLDSSGSMKWPHPLPPGWNPDKDDRAADPTKGERRRFDFALDALSKVLKKIPNNTQLSIIRFGRESDTATHDIPKMIRPPSNWRQSQYDDVFSQFKDSPLVYASPIAKAIMMGMRDGFPADYRGQKVVLVLTDGYDNNSFSTTSQAPPNKRVAQALQEANQNHRDVEVAVICFVDSGHPDRIVAEEQFRIVEKFDPPGTFQFQGRGEDLGRTVEESLRPRLHLFEGGQVARGFPPRGHLVNHPDSQVIDWRQVAPRNYTTRVQQQNTNNVDLREGQNILALLKRDGAKMLLERAVIGSQWETEKEGALHDKKDGWLLTLFEHNITNGKLKQLQLLEDQATAVGDKGIVEHTPPALAWLEFEAVETKNVNKLLRWHYDWSYPAPGIRTEMAWPYNQAERKYFTPMSNLWFARDLPRQASISTKKMLPIGPDDLQEVIEVGPTKIVVESISVEEHPVLVKPETTTMKRSLVVRIQHPVGRPVWVKLDKEQPGVGEEHQYFKEAGKSTAFFYDLPGINSREIELRFFCIESFKEKYPRATFSPQRPIAAADVFRPVAPE